MVLAGVRFRLGVTSIAFFACVSLLACLGSGCALYQGEIDGNGFKFPFEPQALPNTGPLGSLDGIVPLSFPFPDAVPESASTDTQVSEITLNTIGIRMIDDKDYDSHGNPIDARLKDETLVGPCEAGQPSIDFLKSLDILIQKSGNGNPAVRIAHYCNSTSPTDCAAADRPAQVTTGRCGFFMTVDIDPKTGSPYDLKSFLPQYTVTTNAVGSAPPSGSKVGGFVAVDWKMPGAAIPPSSQPAQ